MKVATIGGGGGHSALVSVLKNFPISLTALCNTVDDGGSSGRLRREYGVHDQGDVRGVLSALAGDRGKELGYRFQGGSLQGHTVGNILLTSFELNLGSQQAAIDRIRDWYGIHNRVAPMTNNNPVLHARTTDDQEVVGQSAIVKYLWSTDVAHIEAIWVDPADEPLSAIARDALQEADYIIVAMGDLYSSIAPSFCLTELKELLPKSKAKVIWLPNAVAPKSHVHYETTTKVLSFLQTLSPGFQPDMIVAHSAEVAHSTEKVLQDRGYRVSTMDLEPSAKMKILREDLLDATYLREKTVGDNIERSPVRYDLKKLKKIFEKILV